jgi:hypothetical protein
MFSVISMGFFATQRIVCGQRCSLAGSRMGETGKEAFKMHPDAYTKCALTAIAVALYALMIQNGILKSKAQDNPTQKVQICDDHDCLRLSPLRKRASTGDRFLSFALPIFIESDSR